MPFLLVQLSARVGKNHDFHDFKSLYFLDFFKLVFSSQGFFQVFETGLSAQSHKQHMLPIFPVFLLLSKK